MFFGIKWEITYLDMIIAVTIIWIAVRGFAAIKSRRVSVSREAQLLLLYVCIIVIARFVYFPLHHVDGHIDTLRFDASKMIPPWVNLVPLVHLSDVYDGWQVNIIGNIAMFIPVGVVLPVCFGKLCSIGKTILAGAACIACIEVTQLLFYERCSDVDDLLLNTAGVAIGAMIYFGIKKIGRKKQGSDSA